MLDGNVTMKVHEHLLERHDLADWHYDHKAVLQGEERNRHGSFSDAPAWTHCICYGAAAKATEPLLVEIERLREEVERAHLARIEAQNPGIDIEQVRRERDAG